MQWPTGKQNYNYKTPISHAMGLLANKIILWNTNFICNGPARQTELSL